MSGSLQPFQESLLAVVLAAATAATAATSTAAANRTDAATPAIAATSSSVAAGALAAARPHAQDSAEPAPAVRRAPRGSASSFTIRSSEPLQAKALRDATAPVLVRVNPAGRDAAEPSRAADSTASDSMPIEYRIEFIGAVEGTFDLAEAIERVDGRPAEGLPDLRVEIYTQLPPDHGTDVFGLAAPGVSLSTSYSVTLWTLAAAWVAVPLVVVARRAMQPRPRPSEPAPAAPSVASRLFAIVDEARGRELDVAERGRLELLMLQTLREARDGAGDTRRGAGVSPIGAAESPIGAAESPIGAAESRRGAAESRRGAAESRRGAASDLATLAAAIAALRDDPRDGPVVRAVEAWLHAPTPGDRARALAALDALRVSHAVHSSTGADASTRTDAGGAP